MVNQQLQIKLGLLACRCHPVNQDKQGSLDWHRHHPRRSHRQEECKLHLHHHPGDQVWWDKLRLHPCKTTYRTRESRINQNAITSGRIDQPTIHVANTGKGRKTRKSQHMKYHLDLEYQQEDLWYPGQTLSQKTLVLVDHPSSAQHVENTHTAEENVHTTTSAPHATITIMLHTCVGHPGRHHNRVLQFVYIASVPSTVLYNAHNRHIAQEALARDQEFQHTNGNILGKCSLHVNKQSR